MGESRSPGGRIRGIPEEAGGICAESPAGAESQSARKNLPARGALRGRDCRRCGHSTAG